jgi:hypothetical protein
MPVILPVLPVLSLCGLGIVRDPNKRRVKEARSERQALRDTPAIDRFGNPLLIAIPSRF